MNKSEFIKRLKEKTDYSDDRCVLVNDILESNFIFGRKNKEKIIHDLILKNFTEDEAENIYDISMNIIMSEIKSKVTHPFRRKN
ncbi:MAG: hypothetical protein IJE05_04400 [Clostridia bacterium]|nr:hypothetical protein [Clostridia bacterium]